MITRNRNAAALASDGAQTDHPARKINEARNTPDGRPCPADGETIAKAATWLADNRATAEQPLTRTLRLRFGLQFVDAAKAMAEAERIERRRADAVL